MIHTANMTNDAYQTEREFNLANRFSCITLTLPLFPTAVWEFYYSARESYGPFVGNLSNRDSLDAKFWHRLTEVFVEDGDAFQLYVSRYNRGARPIRCRGKCKDYTICNMRAMRTQDNCVSSRF